MFDARVDELVTEPSIFAALNQACEAIAANPKDQAAVQRLTQLVAQSEPQQEQGLNELLSTASPAVQEADWLLKQDRIKEAEILLRRRLAQHPGDAWAMLGLADVAQRCGFIEDAEKILKRSIEIAPTLVPNWIALAHVFYHRARSQEKLTLIEDAIDALNTALGLRPGDAAALWQKICILMETRRLEEAKLTLESLLCQCPMGSHVWMNYGHLLKTLGEFGRAVAAYRMAVILEPENAAAWWGLANLKLFNFFDTDVEAMERALSKCPTEEARLELHFALAKALDGMGSYNRAAKHLTCGNQLRLAAQPHSREEVARTVDEAMVIHSPDFFEAHAGQGSPSNAPIFIVGLPRSGSTLLEQILSSHSQVEGTEELLGIQLLEAEFRKRHEDMPLEKAIAAARPAEIRELGDRYLELAGLRRTSDRPFFIDKNPANWRYAGLIGTIPSKRQDHRFAA